MAKTQTQLAREAQARRLAAARKRKRALAQQSPDVYWVNHWIGGPPADLTAWIARHRQGPAVRRASA